MHFPVATSPMNGLIYLFGSGLAFFVGVILVVAAVALFSRVRGGWRASLITILALVGLAVIVLSAAPLSLWLYGLAVLVTFVWLAAERVDREWFQRRRTLLRRATVAVWIGATLLEVPYQFSPRLEAHGDRALYILGDSVSAGIGEQQTWSDLLPADIEVHNLARPGATVRTALKQCEGLPPEAGLVLLEIGGNDLLGETSSAEFAHDLDRLLSSVTAPSRTVVMFELPLPPLANEYGRVQRRLAAHHGVRLIPKRILIGVLAADGTTLDSIHLSEAGHARMADAVWQVVGPACRAGP